MWAESVLSNWLAMHHRRRWGGSVSNLACRSHLERTLVVGARLDHPLTERSNNGKMVLLQRKRRKD